ncbi:MAG: hypothetical protein ACOCQ0_02975, partial [Desulfosalsimonas sp.]
HNLFSAFQATFLKKHAHKILIFLKISRKKGIKTKAVAHSNKTTVGHGPGACLLCACCFWGGIG